MATVSASLKMFDMMTRPLQQVAQSLNSTISSMDRLSNSANTDIKLASTLNSTSVAVQKTSNSLDRLANEQNKAANQQNKVNNSFNQGRSATDGLVGKIKGLVGAYLGFQAVKQGLDSTVGGAMRAQQQLFTIQGIMGNKDVGTAYFENLRNQANKSTFAFEDFANNARKFMQFTKNTDSLDKLGKLSERLTLMDPAQGLEGAGFALKEMMSGDGTSLKERFGFGKADIEILKASKSMDQFIGKFDTLLSKKGFSEQMLEQYNQSAAAQLNNLKSNLRTGLASAGQGALDALMPVITGLNNAFNSGTFQGLFNDLATGLSIMANIAVKVGNVFQWIGSVVQSNWGIIAPIVFGIVGALIIYKGAMLAGAIATGISSFINSVYAVGAYKACASLAATELAIYGKVSAQTVEAMATASATAAQQGLNAELYACPITWIILAIIILIVIFYAVVGIINKVAGTSISATGIIVGAFFALGAFLWNLLLAVFEFILGIINALVNPFIKIANFIGNIFTNPISSIIYAFQGMADGILATLQKIASAMDFVFGSKMADTVGSWRTGLKGMADAAVKKYAPNENYKNVMNELNLSTSSLGLKRLDYDKSYNSGYNLGKSAEGKLDLSKMLKPDLGKNMPDTDLAAWNASKGPGELSMGDPDSKKHLKNIDDKIDVSNEHLETLRDLAEQESVQNFVALTPTVQVTTGDIKGDADIDTIIAKIETYMQTELVNSAEGVYA